MKRALYILTLFAASTTVLAQPGSLDLNMNGAGFKLVDMGAQDIATKVLVQPDAKVIITGTSQTPTSYDFAVARLYPDGSPDATFSYDGKVSTAISSTAAVSFDALLQPDGKVVVSGYGNTGGNSNTFFVRYNTDGSLDNTFGSGGIVSLTTGPNGLAALAVTMQADGKIIGAGSYDNGTDVDFMAVRINIDGALDYSFNLDGIANYDNGGNYEVVRDVLVRPDGTILLVGTTINTITTDKEVMVMGLDSDGYLDNNFGSNGIVEIDFGMLNNDGQAVALQGGKILVAGFADIGTPVVMTVARLMSDGTMDNSFGTLGEVTVPFYTGNTAEAYSVVPQPDGRILLGGGAYNGPDKSFAVARLNYNGTLDATFDTDGKVQTDLGGFENGYSLALQPDGLILLAGRASGISTLDFTVVRYISGMNIGIGEVDAYIGSTLIYPNPVTDNTITVEYELSSEQVVSIELFDLSGKQISVLQSEAIEKAGFYKKTLALPALSAGNYLLKLNTEKGSVTVKLTVN